MGSTAVDWYAAALVRHPKCEALTHARARALVRAGELERAAEAWQPLEPDSLDDRAAAWLSALADEATTPGPISPELCHELIGWLEGWALSGLESQLEASLQEIRAGSGQWPDLDRAVCRWLSR